MKKIEVEIPEGKRAEWVDNVLTLVDDKPVNIMEKVTAYYDACKILEIENFLDEPNPIMNMMGIDYEIPKNVIAMMKLETIIEALNEGWVAAENINDQWWFPWFYRFDKCTESKYNGFISAKSYSDSGMNRGVAFAYPDHDLSRMYSFYGSRLALKSSELAEYCGKQFIQLWADYLLG